MFRLDSATRLLARSALGTLALAAGLLASARPAGALPPLCYPDENGGYCVPMCDTVPCPPQNVCAHCPAGTQCDPVAAVCILPCGDGQCLAGVEDCGVCPQDCPCPDGQSCQNRQCATGGGGGGGGYCGNGVCAGAENCSTCPQDCCPGGECGNGVVDPGETCASCLADVAAKADFTASHLAAQPGELLTFTARPERYLPSMPVLWDMGNATHLEGTPMRYSYPSTGQFPVILTVTDPICRSTQLSDPQFITIQNPSSCSLPGGACCGNGQCDGQADELCPEDCEPPPPRCDTVVCNAGCALRPEFTATQSVAVVGVPVTFTAHANTVAGTVMNWDFGDTQHCDGCGLSVSHTYNQTGTYSVILTATDTVCGTGILSYPLTLRVRQPTEPGPLDDARVVASSVPSCLAPGERRNVSVRIWNFGWSDWLYGYGLALLPGSSQLTGLTGIGTGEHVGYLGSHDYDFPITAPTTPGRYYLGLQMRSDQGVLFGELFQQWVEVTPSCTGSGTVGSGRYGCEASVRTENNLPVPDVQVSLFGYTLVAGGEPTLVDSVSALTDANGHASIRWEPPTSVQQLYCSATVGLSQEPPIVSVSNPVEVPPTVLELNVTQLAPLFTTKHFRGLKQGDAVAHLIQNGPYDKPVVIPMPFDPGEQTPEALNYWILVTRFFYPVVELAAENGWDLIFVTTSSGQNIHEQAAEFAQVIDYAAQLLGPGGKVVVAAYSLGGVNARLSTARYEADLDWVHQLGLVNEELPVELVMFGDAPLEGAHANYCLTTAVWFDLNAPFAMKPRAKFNLNSCGAQQLLRIVAPYGSQNHDAFYENGTEVFFPNDPCYKVDHNQQGLCRCDAGPAVFTVNGDGWAHGPELVGFSSGDYEPNSCYLNDQDVGPFGRRVCDQPPVGPNLGFPGPVEVGDALYKIRVPLGSDYICYADALDVEGGSRYSTPLTKVECGSIPGTGHVCGGIEQWISAVFIPVSSALPAGAPFSEALPLGFNGTHVRFYPLQSEFVVRVINGAFEAIRSRMTPDEQSRIAAAEAARVTASPQVLVQGTLSQPVTVVLPGVTTRRRVDTVTVEHLPAGAGQPAGYQGLGPPAVYRVGTNLSFQAGARDPISVCVAYGPYDSPKEENVRLFRLGEEGWQPIVTYVDVAGDRVCGNAPALGVFGVFAPANQRPVAVAVAPDVQVGAGGTGTLVLNGAGSSDPEGDRLSYTWKDAQGLVVGSTAIVELSRPAGTYSFTLEVLDIPEHKPVKATVAPTVNRPPTVSVAGGGSCHPRPQVPCSKNVTGTASDPDGHPLTFSWSGCATGSAATASCQVTTLGANVATVTVRDNHGGSATASLSSQGTNQTPVYTSIGFDQPAPLPVDIDAEAEFTLSDPDGDDACHCTVGQVAGACTLVSSSCANQVFTVQFHTRTPVGQVGLCYVKYVRCRDVWQAEAYNDSVAIEVTR